ncbi:uncharacterized protein LOC124373007 [Homalodisca vitripennis]|uniref:uncharacterized protein LOC124373007 n=1 Tax=Homalodisca vitripennis TaxID=197043 RepID=UPI001EEBBA97|nr:uncharacterized protein LOC124373007 [Homalodisca vitripennis]
MMLEIASPALIAVLLIVDPAIAEECQHVRGIIPIFLETIFNVFSSVVTIPLKVVNRMANEASVYELVKCFNPFPDIYSELKRGVIDLHITMSQPVTWFPWFYCDDDDCDCDCDVSEPLQHVNCDYKKPENVNHDCT